MAIKNELFSRIQLKYDSYSAWTTAPGKDLVLKAGEMGICAIPSGSTAVNGDNTRPQILFKVGDGTSTFEALPWASAKAADVYDWAKAEKKPEYQASEIKNLASYISGQIQDTNTDTRYTFDIPAEGDNAGKLVVTATVYDKGVAGTSTTTAYDLITSSEMDAKIAAVIADYSTTAQMNNAISAAEGRAATDATNKANKALEDAKDYADGLADNYATAVQGEKADSAVQSVSIATGSANGKVKLTVDGQATEASVAGLKSAAYTESSAYATAAQGSKADSAVQSVKVLGETLTDGDELTVAEAKTALGLKSAAYTESSAYATAAQGTKADNAATQTALNEEIARAKKAEGEALAAAQAAQADIDTFMGTIASDTEAVDTLAEVIALIESGNDVATGLLKDVADLKAADTGLDGRLDIIEGDYLKSADIANMATTSYVDTAKEKAIETAGENADSKIAEALKSYTNTSGMNSAISTAKQGAIDTAAADATSKANAAEQNAKDYADGLADNYATAAQGAKADSAVQTVTTGTANGTIAVDGTNVTVKGLKSAAYTESSDYATAAQGRKANTALQEITGGTGINVSGDIVWENVAYESVGVAGIMVNQAVPANYDYKTWIVDVAINGNTYYNVGASGSSTQTTFREPDNLSVGSTGTATIVFHNPNPTVSVNTTTIATVSAMNTKATQTLNSAKSYADSVIETTEENYFVINCGSATTVI